MARRSTPSPVDGLALVDKAAGWTSHDVVAKSRGQIGTRKIGHAGTLDPPATGLLLIGVGRMTRLLRFLTALPKTYEGEVVLGAETTTLDDTGEVTATFDMSDVSFGDLRTAAAALTGPIMQVPPMVSAVKVDGIRLHELARAGKEVDRAPRPVTIHSFEIGAATEPGIHPITVTCSSGTYIRTLAEDLGRAVGGGAHLRNLRRTHAGSFSVGDAVPVEALAIEHVMPMADALRDLTRVAVDEATAAAVRFGRPLPRIELGVPEDSAGPFAVVDRDQALLAVYEPHRAGTLKPAVVVAPA